MNMEKLVIELELAGRRETRGYCGRRPPRQDSARVVQGRATFGEPTAKLQVFHFGSIRAFEMK
jgi:hypothetical protein